MQGQNILGTNGFRETQELVPKKQVGIGGNF